MKQCLAFRPLPHEQGSFRLRFGGDRMLSLQSGSRTRTPCGAAGSSDSPSSDRSSSCATCRTVPRATLFLYSMSSLAPKPSEFLATSNSYAALSCASTCAPPSWLATLRTMDPLVYLLPSWSVTRGVSHQSTNEVGGCSRSGLRLLSTGLYRSSCAAPGAPSVTEHIQSPASRISAPGGGTPMPVPPDPSLSSTPRWVGTDPLLPGS